MGDTVRLPAIGGKPEGTTRMSREEFKSWVKELGQHKTYTETPYIDFFGEKTTFRKTVDYMRQLFAVSDNERQQKLSKLSDSELLQYLRNSDEMLSDDPRFTEQLKNKQKSLNTLPMV